MAKVASPSTSARGTNDRREAAQPPPPRELSAAGAWRRRHLLDLDDFSSVELELVMETADTMKEVLAREVPRLPTLRGTTVVTLFYENSTRTRASFELAGKVLGADVINLTAGASSVQKGESLIDTVRTIQAIGADLLIMRHGSSGAPYLAARESSFRVVNAGDGWHAHPTQALLDLYTMRAHLGDPSTGSGQALRGRKIVIVGDIAHSRVARSNLWGLTALGAEVVVCGPPTLLPAGLDGRCRDDAGEGAPSTPLRAGLPPVRVEHDLDRAIAGADVVMGLRLQLERQQAGLIPTLREYARLYQVTAERLARAKPGALVMHPGPMNEGVEIAADVAHGARSLIEEQVTNGVAVRMAVLYLLLRGGGPE
jgi:aspartate carbamoyltransferase catalytic subunit